MDQIVSYAFLGGSQIALKMLQAAQQSDNSHVVLLASKSGDRLQLFKKMGIDEHVSEYTAVLEDRRVQAVYISLANSQHYEWIKKALLCGKHVLCEKPMVLELWQLEELRAIASREKLILMEAFWYRFHPLLDRVCGMIRAGGLGRLAGFHSTFNFMTCNEADIRWNRDLGGGAINDLFCYHADAICYLTGLTCADISAIEGFARFRNDVDASVCVEIAYHTGLQAQLVASIERSSSNRTLITGEKGMLTLPHLRLDPGFSDHSCTFLSAGGTTIINEGYCNPYARMLTAFSAAVLGQSRAQLVTLEESLENLKLMNMARKAVAVEMQDRIALYPAVLGFGRRIMKKYFCR